MYERIRKEYPYLYETHLHTSEGSACGRSTGREIAEACKEYGYAGIFVTDHNWGGTLIFRPEPGGMNMQAHTQKAQARKPALRSYYLIT